MGWALGERGVRIECIASRGLEHARAAASLFGRTLAVGYGEIARHASHVLVAVSDRAIEAVAAEIAGGGGGVRVALHTCGARGAEALAPLAAAGARCGTLHPLQTIRDPVRGAAALRGAAFAVSGDPEAVAWAVEIAGALQGQVLRIADDTRPLYHAAAVMASNYVAALVDCAAQLMERAGVSREEALRALAPLVRTAVENVAEQGAVGALTGPVVRGDAATVAGHMRALTEGDESVTALYRAAGLHALRMALQRGLGEKEAEAVRQALLGGR